MKKGFLIGAFWGTLLGGLILLVAAVAFVVPARGPVPLPPDPVAARGIGAEVLALLSGSPGAEAGSVSPQGALVSARNLMPRPPQVRMPEGVAFPPLPRVEDVPSAPEAPPMVLAVPGRPGDAPPPAPGTVTTTFLPAQRAFILPPQDPAVPGVRPDLVGGLPRAAMPGPDWTPSLAPAPTPGPMPGPIAVLADGLDRTAPADLRGNAPAVPDVPVLPDPAPELPDAARSASVLSGPRVAFVVLVQDPIEADHLPVWALSAVYPLTMAATEAGGREWLVLLPPAPSVTDLTTLADRLTPAGGVVAVVMSEGPGDDTAAVDALLRQTGTGVLDADKTRPGAFLAARAAGLKAGLVYAGFPEAAPGAADFAALAERARRDGQVVVLLGPGAVAAVGDWLASPEGQALTPVPVSDLLN